jgi:hypothetical protein
MCLKLTYAENMKSSIRLIALSSATLFLAACMTTFGERSDAIYKRQMESIYGDRAEEVMAERAFDISLEREKELFEERKTYIRGYMKTNKISGEPVIAYISPLDISLPWLRALRNNAKQPSIDDFDAFHRAAYDKAFKPAEAPVPVHDEAVAEVLADLINSGRKNIVVSSSDSLLAERTLEEAINRVEARDKELIVYLQSDRHAFLVSITPPEQDDRQTRKLSEQERRIEERVRRDRERIGLQGIPWGSKALAKNIMVKIIPQ